MNHNKITIKEHGLGMKGFVQIKRLVEGTADAARTLAAEIALLRKEAIFAELREDYQTAGRLVAEAAQLYREYLLFLQERTLGVASENHNLVMASTDRGANLILRALGNGNSDLTTYSLAITHGELGTGNDTPAAGDTGNETAADRQTLTLASMTSLTGLKLQFFWADAELANGTYSEIATFANGSSGLGTGRIINRALLLPTYTKASAEDTTMEINFTLTPL